MNTQVKLLKKGLKRLLSYFAVPIFYNMNKSKVRIIMYHRFTRSFSHHKLPVQAFENHCRDIVKKYSPITLSDYARFLREDRPYPDNSVIITFDDAYKDFFELAYPVLKKYQLNATLFITTEFIDKKIWLWPDMLRFIANTTPLRGYTFKTSDQQEVRFDLNIMEEKVRLWHHLSTACLYLKEYDRGQFIEYLSKDLRVKLPALPTSEFSPVSWDNLIEMQKNEIDVGSHSLTHPILSVLTSERKREEVVESRKIIENRIQTTVCSFCYPNGDEKDFDDEVVELVRRAGYFCAVTAMKGFNGNNVDLFRLRRLTLSSPETGEQLSGLENFFEMYSIWNRR